MVKHTMFCQENLISMLIAVTLVTAETTAEHSGRNVEEIDGQRIPNEDDTNHWGSCVCQCPDIKCPDMKCPEMRCPEVHVDCGQRAIKDEPVKPTVGCAVEDPASSAVPSTAATSPQPVQYKDCQELLDHGEQQDTIYSVLLGDENQQYSVYCDMEDDKGWLIFQRREIGNVNFKRTFAEYQNGFGELSGDFWLGNDALHLLTQQKSYTLRVVIGDFDDVIKYADYSTFNVAGVHDKYRLTVAGYTGNAGDAMSYHNGSMFSTIDQDNDVGSSHCAENQMGGWWYNNCYYSNLNGVYYNPEPTPVSSTCIRWRNSNVYYVQKYVEMKLRPNA